LDFSVIGFWEIVGGGGMVKHPDTIPVTDLKQDASAMLKRVRKSKRPLILTQRGKAAAVLLSVDTYEKGERERKILKLLARGEREIAAGKGYDLDDVLAEADALLSKA
jgi:prevent-host-death family protein